MWSAGISVESYARLASRVYSRGDRFLYGYYNSEQHLIQVKICTAVDKDKGVAHKMYVQPLFLVKPIVSRVQSEKYFYNIYKIISKCQN